MCAFQAFTYSSRLPRSICLTVSMRAGFGAIASAEFSPSSAAEIGVDCFAIPAVNRSASAARSEPFEDRRDPLAAADAHRHQRVTPANPLQLIERLGRDHSPN